VLRDVVTESSKRHNTSSQISRRQAQRIRLVPLIVLGAAWHGSGFCFQQRSAVGVREMTISANAKVVIFALADHRGAHRVHEMTACPGTSVAVLAQNRDTFANTTFATFTVVLRRVHLIVVHLGFKKCCHVFLRHLLRLRSGQERLLLLLLGGTERKRADRHNGTGLFGHKHRGKGLQAAGRAGTQVHGICELLFVELLLLLLWVMLLLLDSVLRQDGRNGGVFIKRVSEKFRFSHFTSEGDVHSGRDDSKSGIVDIKSF